VNKEKEEYELGHSALNLWGYKLINSSFQGGVDPYLQRIHPHLMTISEDAITALTKKTRKKKKK